MTGPRIVGLDLSLTSSGVAVLADGEVTVSRVRSVGKKGDSLLARGRRLNRLKVQLLDLCDGADLVVIEGPAMNVSASASGAVHDRGGLWWLVVHSLIASGVPVMEIAPRVRAKYATGKGNAAKDAVFAAVLRRYTEVPIANNDEADAVVMVAIGARVLGVPIEPSLPQLNLDVMPKLHLPEDLVPPAASNVDAPAAA